MESSHLSPSPKPNAYLFRSVLGSSCEYFIICNVEEIQDIASTLSEAEGALFPTSINPYFCVIPVTENQPIQWQDKRNAFFPFSRREWHSSIVYDDSIPDLAADYNYSLHSVDARYPASLQWIWNVCRWNVRYRWQAEDGQDGNVSATVAWDRMTGRALKHSYRGFCDATDYYVDSSGAVKLNEGGGLAQRRWPLYKQIMAAVSAKFAPFSFDAQGVVRRVPPSYGAPHLLYISDPLARRKTNARNATARDARGKIIQDALNWICNNFPLLNMASYCWKDMNQASVTATIAYQVYIGDKQASFLCEQVNRLKAFVKSLRDAVGLCVNGENKYGSNFTYSYYNSAAPFGGIDQRAGKCFDLWGNTDAFLEELDGFIDYAAGFEIDRIFYDEDGNDTRKTETGGYYAFFWANIRHDPVATRMHFDKWVAQTAPACDWLQANGVNFFQECLRIPELVMRLERETLWNSRGTVPEMVHGGRKKGSREAAPVVARGKPHWFFPLSIEAQRDYKNYPRQHDQELKGIFKEIAEGTWQCDPVSLVTGPNNTQRPWKMDVTPWNQSGRPQPTVNDPVPDPRPHRVDKRPCRQWNWGFLTHGIGDGLPLPPDATKGERIGSFWEANGMTIVRRHLNAGRLFLLLFPPYLIEQLVLEIFHIIKTLLAQLEETCGFDQSLIGAFLRGKLPVVGSVMGDIFRELKIPVTQIQGDAGNLPPSPIAGDAGNTGGGSVGGA